jgi:hypothetical protein
MFEALKSLYIFFCLSIELFWLAIQSVYENSLDLQMLSQLFKNVNSLYITVLWLLLVNLIACVVDVSVLYGDIVWEPATSHPTYAIEETLLT